MQYGSRNLNLYFSNPPSDLPLAPQPRLLRSPLTSPHNLISNLPQPTPLLLHLTHPHRCNNNEYSRPELLLRSQALSLDFLLVLRGQLDAHLTEDADVDLVAAESLAWVLILMVWCLEVMDSPLNSHPLPLLQESFAKSQILTQSLFSSTSCFEPGDLLDETLDLFLSKFIFAVFARA
jgi:hypothetical protein